jgi:tetratricopeptide (TPR) repeat protein
LTRVDGYGANSVVLILAHACGHTKDSPPGTLEEISCSSRKDLVSIRSLLNALFRSASGNQTANTVESGNKLLRQGRVDAAIIEFREAVRRNPDDAQAHERLANALSLKGRRGEAIAEYRTSLAVRPDPGTYAALGITLQEMGSYPEAISMFAAAIKLDPNHVMAHFFLGEALRDTHELDNAESEFRECVRLSASDPDSHWALADVLERKGELHQAAEEYCAALSLAPNDLGIRESYRLLPPELKRLIRGLKSRRSHTR